MNGHEHGHLERWRTAEAAGREAEAEAALAALLVRLPRLDPPPGFAARIAAAAAAETAAAARRSWWWTAGIAAALALAAGTMASLAPEAAGPVAGSLASRLSVHRLIDGLAAAVTALAGWLSGAAGLWAPLADVAGALATAAGTRPVVLAVVAALAVAAMALRLLSNLIATERSWSHVPSRG